MARGTQKNPVRAKERRSFPVSLVFFRYRAHPATGSRQMPPTRKRPRVICMGWKAPSTAGSFSTTSIVEKIKVANPMQTQPNKKFCFSRIPLPPVARPKIVHGSL